ncbi:MAG: Nif3-like dinuclear metal center hexameric protein [Pseudomonadota bacterium]
MIQIHTLERWCNQQLQAENFSDYCPNGTQVEGGREIQRLASGVTACQALLDAAVEWQADAILVHHGYFWNGESQPLTGIKGRRIRSLMQNDISLLAYHLPLDAHPMYGNNAQLGRRLQLHNAAATEPGDGLLWSAELLEPVTPRELAASIKQAVAREPLHIAAERASIRRVGWCTGGAQKYIDQAADLALDAFISGEISEATVHTARERNIHYYAAGHHATERYGVQALGEAIASEFGITHRYFEIDNPV